MRINRRDARSVSGYRETLDVLGRLQGRGRGTRPLSAPAAGREPEGPGREPPTPGPARAQPGGEPGEPIRGPAGPGPRGPAGPAPRGSLGPLGPRPSRRGVSAGVAALALVLVAGAAVAYGVARSHHGPSPSPAATHRAHDASTTTTTTTTTTLPSSYTAVSAGPSSATYVPTTASYSLQLGATSGNCWMSVTAQDGTTVFAKTLAPGTTATVSLSGQATVLIGAPTVATLSAGGIPLQLPSSIVGPFTVTLAPK